MLLLFVILFLTCKLLKLFAFRLFKILIFGNELLLLLFCVLVFNFLKFLPIALLCDLDFS